MKHFYGVHALSWRADLTAPVTARSLCLSLCPHLFLWAEDNLESHKDRCQTCEASVSRSEDDMLQNVGVARPEPADGRLCRACRGVADVKHSWLRLTERLVHVSLRLLPFVFIVPVH